MTLTEQFQKSLYENKDYNNEFAVIYERLLIKLHPEGQFERDLKYLFDEYCKGNMEWMFEFHKSIRQNDFFNVSYIMEYNAPSITEEERKERKELLQIRHDKRLELKEKYSREYFNKEFTEQSLRINELNLKFFNKEQKNIASHLDVILYSIISSDNGFLEKVFKNCFEDFKHYQNKQEKGLIE